MSLLPTCSRHADREAEPKDYDVCDPTVKRDLLRATYKRIGDAVDDVSAN